MPRRWCEHANRCSSDAIYISYSHTEVPLDALIDLIDQRLPDHQITHYVAMKTRTTTSGEYPVLVLLRFDKPLRRRGQTLFDLDVPGGASYGSVRYFERAAMIMKKSPSYSSCLDAADGAPPLSAAKYIQLAVCAAKIPRAK